MKRVKKCTPIKAEKKSESFYKIGFWLSVVIIAILLLLQRCSDEKYIFEKNEKCNEIDSLHNIANLVKKDYDSLSNVVILQASINNSLAKVCDSIKNENQVLKNKINRISDFKAVVDTAGLINGVLIKAMIVPSRSEGISEIFIKNNEYLQVSDVCKQKYCLDDSKDSINFKLTKKYLSINQ